MENEIARAVSKAWETRWLVSTSRRTPDEVADRVAAAAEEERVVERFIDYRSAGPGTLPEIFALADVILCTEDSSTMIRKRYPRVCQWWVCRQQLTNSRKKRPRPAVPHRQWVVPRASHRRPLAGKLRGGAFRGRAEQGEPARRARGEAEGAIARAVLSKCPLNARRLSGPQNDEDHSE